MSARARCVIPNPTLALVTNPGPRSESDAWAHVEKYAENILRKLERVRDPNSIRVEADGLHALAHRMSTQVKLGIHTNPGASGRSESTAWRRIAGAVADGMREVRAGNGTGALAQLRVVEGIAAAMLAQVARGVHVNPARGGKVFGSDVQAIVYRNSDVRKFPYRAHAFGGHPFDLTNRGDALTIHGIVDRTGIECVALADGTVLLRHKRGLPIWEDLPDEEAP